MARYNSLLCNVQTELDVFSVPTLKITGHREILFVVYFSKMPFSILDTMYWFDKVYSTINLSRRSHGIALRVF